MDCGGADGVVPVLVRWLGAIGVAYDHVFPIEIEQPGGEGVKTLKIGYNIGDNPFLAAQAFIVRPPEDCHTPLPHTYPTPA